jgi:hypothetical protein
MDGLRLGLDDDVARTGSARKSVASSSREQAPGNTSEFPG